MQETFLSSLYHTSTAPTRSIAQLSDESCYTFRWGDGIVDLQDLTVLAEYLGKEVIDPALIAHWTLDETEGGAAHDTAGANNGIVMGGPLWQPAGGQVDGKWHRIALIWDGSRRMLCVDGVMAAEDTQEALPSSGNDLYIGVGNGYASRTFWSGLIDDARIYNRAVRP